VTEKTTAPHDAAVGGNLQPTRARDSGDFAGLREAHRMHRDRA
jgi:hypothetical protein